MASYNTTRPEATTTLYDLAVALASARATAEHELIASIFADPGRGIAVAERVGVAHFDFDQPDLRTLFLAADVARHLAKPQIMAFCETALRRAGLWDAEQVAGQDSGDGTGSMRWSRKALEALGDSFPFCPAVIRDSARRVRGLKRVHDDCRNAYSDIVHRITAAVSPVRASTTTSRIRGAA